MTESNESGLAKVLSKRETLVLAFGAMIGWGWIILSGTWINEAGPMGAIVAFLLGGLMVGVVAVIYGELASAMPFVGGEHVYSHRALGSTGSFICTWAIIFGYVTVAAFEAVAFPSALAYVIPNFNTFELWSIAGEPVYGTWIVAGLLATVAITYLNYRGIRVAAQFQIIMTIVIASAGLLLIFGAIPYGKPSPDPAFTSGTAGVFAVVLTTPFMFVGFDIIPQSAEEADIAPDSLGKLIFTSVFLAALFYIAVIWGTSRALPGAELVESTLPAAEAMATLFGSPLVGQLMALAGIAGILTSWNAFIIGGSRAIFALAESGMLPQSLANVHPEHETPSTAIVLVGAIAGLATLFGEQMLNWVVNAGGLGIVTAWFLVTVSFLVLRYREPEMERPYSVPAGYAVGVFGLVLTAFFVTLYLPGGPSALVWPYEWLIVLAWALLGIALYLYTVKVSSDTISDPSGSLDSLED